MGFGDRCSGQGDGKRQRWILTGGFLPRLPGKMAKREAKISRLAWLGKNLHRSIADRAV